MLKEIRKQMGLGDVPILVHYVRRFQRENIPGGDEGDKDYVWGPVRVGDLVGSSPVLRERLKDLRNLSLVTHVQRIDGTFATLPSPKHVYPDPVLNQIVMIRMTEIRGAVIALPVGDEIRIGWSKVHQSDRCALDPQTIRHEALRNSIRRAITKHQQTRLQRKIPDSMIQDISIVVDRSRRYFKNFSKFMIRNDQGDWVPVNQIV